MISEAGVRDYVDRLARAFSLELVILFGSVARGGVTPDSDVDLFVVLEHDGKSWETAARLRKAVRPTFPCDLIVRTPKQLRDRLALGDVFLRDIVERGKILHDARHG